MTAKYWTKDGRSIWRLEEKTVFLFQNLETGEQVTFDGLDESKFLPVSMPEPKKKRVQKSKDKKANPKSKYIHSDYKGVRGLASGRWEAKYYDSKKKKVVYIGMFDDELTAAIKVLEKEGNYVEAHKLQQKKAATNSVQTGMNPGDYQG